MGKIIDYTKLSFSNFKVISYSGWDRSHRNKMWVCECNCGSRFIRASSQLKKDRPCEKCAYVRSGMARRHDLTGRKFHYLTAIRVVEENSGRSKLWECRCDCGNITYVRATNLERGSTKSCGCYKIEFAKENGKKTKHNLSHSRVYKIYMGMRYRCNNPNSNEYDRYGGRGIKISPEWDTFEKFYEWAINSGYSPDLTIDRIDNNGDYTPDNCRWATATQQMNNRNCNRYITYNGETHTGTEWARMYGLSYVTFRLRLSRGWSVEKALTTPIDTSCYPKSKIKKE